MEKPLRLTFAQCATYFLPPLIGGQIGHLIYPFTIGKRDQYAFKTQSRTGSWLTGYTNDYVAHYFSVHGYFNYRNLAIALSLCQAGDTIIEVGANIGTETVGFADIVGRKGHVFAFEPFPANITCLRANLALHPCQNTTIMPVALSDSVGKVRFSKPAQDNSGVGRVVRSENKMLQTVEIDCTTLDELIEQIGPAVFLCMDAEGSELFILRGAKQYIHLYQPGIVVETKKSLKAELHDILCTLGYAIFNIGRYGLGSVDIKSKKNEDWFCIAREKIKKSRAVNHFLQQSTFMPFVFGLNPLTHPRVRR